MKNKKRAPFPAPSSITGGVDGTLLKGSNRHATASLYARAPTIQGPRKCPRAPVQQCGATKAHPALSPVRHLRATAGRSLHSLCQQHIFTAAGLLLLHF